jgi:hypothetical protein
LGDFVGPLDVCRVFVVVVHNFLSGYQLSV